MKKNWLLGLTLVASVCASMLVGTPAAAANPKLKIGMAVRRTRLAERHRSQGQC